MAGEHIFVGLEVGTSKICAVVAEAKADGPPRILGVGHTPSRGVRKGEIVDFETAQKCIREAIAAAETQSDIEIASVFLGVSGGHIRGVNNRGITILPEDREEIDEDDVEEVKANAREINIPEDNVFLHAINQYYYVDGKEGVLDPVGQFGRKLEADFHIVHGVRTRIRNTIRCVHEIPITVEEVVLSGLASALVVLNNDEKQMGALVLDIGGGTTDYLVYSDGIVKHSGALAVGGDHITNDLSMGLRIPITKAEILKIEEGSVTLGNSLPGETITLKDDASFSGREIERETLNNIIHLRVREAFELIKSRLDHDRSLDYLGAGVVITGGTSMLQGIDSLAEDIFGLPARRVHAQQVAGITAAVENPQYSTAIGLVKFAQAVQQERGEMSIMEKAKAKFDNMFGWMKPRRRNRIDEEGDL